MHSCPTGVMSGISDNTLQISWDQSWEPEIFYTKLYWHTVNVYLHRHLLCNYWLLAPPVWHLPWISGQDPSLFWSIQNIDPCRLKKWEMNMTNFSINLNLGEGWHASLCMQVKWPTWLELILVSFTGLKSTYSTPAWRVSPSIKFARAHLHHRALSDTSREKCHPQSNNAPWPSGLEPGPLDPKCSGYYTTVPPQIRCAMTENYLLVSIVLSITEPIPAASPKLWYWVSVRPVQVNACTILQKRSC